MLQVARMRQLRQRCCRIHTQHYHLHELALGVFDHGHEVKRHVLIRRAVYDEALQTWYYWHTCVGNIEAPF